MAQTNITISVDIDNYHDKRQIFISIKFKARILLHLPIYLNISIERHSSFLHVLINDTVSKQETGLGCLIILIIIYIFVS